MTSSTHVLRGARFVVIVANMISDDVTNSYRRRSRARRLDRCSRRPSDPLIAVERIGIRAGLHDIFRFQEQVLIEQHADLAQVEVLLLEQRDMPARFLLRLAVADMGRPRI